MYKLIACAAALAALLVAMSCGNTPSSSTSSTSSNSGGACPTAEGGDTPTAAYKRLYAAVKAKNVEDIKKEMSSKTHEFAKSVAARQNSPIEKVFENGFTATTFAETLPEIRDERVNCEFGNVEVYNSKDSRWEDLPFVIEGGTWKLAVGDMFGGSFKSPGKGRDQKEKEAANAANPTNTMIPVNVNMNQNVKVISPKERPEPGMNKANLNSAVNPNNSNK